MTLEAERPRGAATETRQQSGGDATCDRAADFGALFHAMPVNCVVLAPDAPRFTILAATDSYCRVAGVPREAMVGHGLFEVFGDHEPAGAGPHRRVEPELRASLEEVLRTRAPHRPPVQRYDLHDPHGGVVMRYWQPLNVPVLAPDGTVRHVLHHVEDVTDAVVQREAAAAAERRAARILEQVSDSHLTMDAAFRILTVNAAAERTTGMSRDEMVGRTHWELFPATVGSEAERHYRRVQAEGVEAHFAEHYARAEGDLHVEVDAYATDGGGVAVFWRDVTERMRTAAGNAYLAAMVDAAGEAMFGVALDGSIQSANPAVERLLGYAPGEIVGRHIGVLAPESRRAEQAEIFASIRAGQTVSRETVRLASGGRPVDVILTTGPVRNAAGDVIGISATLVDITERKRAEAALRESERRLRAIFDGTREYIGLLAPDGTLLEANHASLGFAGNTREDVVGRPFWDTPWFARTPGVPEAIRDAVRRAAAGELVQFTDELRRPSGELATFDISFHPVRDERGDVVLVVPEGRDVTERQRAETALRDSEARYRALFESLDEGFCVIQLLFDDGGRPVDYRFVEANAEFAEQTGLHGVVGRTALELLPDLEPYWIETYGRVATTGEPLRFESGSDVMGRWFDVYASRVGPAEERRVALLFKDVSAARAAAEERERLVHALEVERARLAYVFQQAPAFLAVLRGPEHVFHLVNEAYYQLVGHRDTVGKPVLDALPEVRDQGFTELLDGVLATGVPFVGRELPLFVERTPGAAAEERFIDLTYMPLVEADGTRSGIIAHGSDVTEQVLVRREVERLLAESERARAEAERAWADAEAARQRTVLLQSLTAALSTASTVDEVARAVVAHGTEVFGAVGTVIARLSADGAQLEIVDAGDMPHDVHDVWSRFPTNAPVPLAEVARTGQPMFLESREEWTARYPHMQPLLDTTGHHANAILPLVLDGRVLGVLGAAFDAPRAFGDDDRTLALGVAHQCAQALERARLYEAERAARAEAEAASAEAEAANRAKGEFLAVMSHELRTPLNAIGGYAELMEMGIRGPVTPAQREDLRRIQTSQRHLLGLINEVLNYAKLETGTVHFDVCDVPVREAIVGAEALVAPQGRAKGLTIVVADCPADLVARADEEKLRQILVNLLSNAVKFTNAGGRIEMSAGADDAALRVRVRDTGIGIPPDKLEAIFDPFVQVRADLTRPQEGTGLGLAISRDLARGMGGELTVASEPGVGSTFTLTLPRA
jgi:PAS domain S-box-containing protein